MVRRQGKPSRSAAGCVASWVTVVLAVACPPDAAAQGSPATPAGEAADPGPLQVDGHTLFVSCRGEAADLPAVIFENGLGEGVDTWRDVLPVVAAETRACAYERPGVRRSDPVPEDDTRTPLEMARTLRALLRSLEIEAPVVLVGHSIGGFVLLAYAHLFPDDVAGLVFVDSSHPEQFDRFREVDPGFSRGPVVGAERIDIVASRDELAAVGTFGDLPLAVLHQAAPTDAPMRPLWIEMQQEHAARSTRSRLTPALESGHYVHNDQPDLVIEAIDWVLRGGG